MSLFLVDSLNKNKVSYQILLEDLSKENNSFYPYLHSTDTYLIFKNLLIGLLSENDVVLLDSDFSKEEVAKMLGNYDKTKSAIPVSLKFDSHQTILDKLKETKSNIGLFTSGTTGTPKLINHNLNVFRKSVRIGERYENHIWGFAYNPTHMAGLQVFFQAFFNQNLIVKIFGLKNQETLGLLNKYQISHLSATPTFYRLLSINEPLDFVRRITFGGEKSGEALYGKMKKGFPNAKINNIYATTEFGTLFISDGDAFKPSTENKDLVKIEDNLLWVHKSLLGMNQDAPVLVADWYCTNDKVEVLSNNPLKFKFLSRVSSTVNIGGYNVDPKETEDVLLTYPGVKIARVFAKANRVLGNMLRAEAVAETGVELSEKEMLDFLKSKLQAHKLPRIIKIVDEVKLTRTGKIKQ